MTPRARKLAADLAAAVREWQKVPRRVRAVLLRNADRAYEEAADIAAGRAAAYRLLRAAGRKR